MNEKKYKTICQYCGRVFEGNFKGNILGSCKAHELCCKHNFNKQNFICEKCGKVFKTKVGFVKHKFFQGEKVVLKEKKEHYTNCIFCGKQILQFASLKAHEKQCKKNPNRIVPKIGLRRLGNNKTGTSWNKGLTADTDERIRKGLIKARERIEELKKQGVRIYNGHAKTSEKQLQRKRKISETMKKNPLCGGKRHGSGRGKKGWYKGYWCDSSWELALVIYNLEHNIKFERNKLFDFI